MSEKRFIIPSYMGGTSDWTNEFTAWNKELTSPVVSLEKVADYDVEWEMHRAEIFKQKNGRYLFVQECGCSCYEPEDANLFPDLSKEEAERHMREFIKDHNSMNEAKIEINPFWLLEEK